MKEALLHKEFSAWLNEQGIPFIHSRTDKRTTTALGDPDYFILYGGRVLGIEIKVGKNMLSKAQALRIMDLRTAGVHVVILRSLEACREEVYNWFYDAKTERQGDVKCPNPKKDIMAQDITTQSTTCSGAVTSKPETAPIDGAKHRYDSDGECEACGVHMTRCEPLQVSTRRTKPAEACTEAVHAEPCAESEPETAPSETAFFVSEWAGKDCVFQKYGFGPATQFVRVATQYDLLNIPRQFHIPRGKR